jgi:DNA (cytosine-5)-methyltransferase 1
MENKHKLIDLFSGCGGLLDGFMQTGKYEHIAAVEWMKPQVDTLRKRLKEKWSINDSNETVLHFDIQRVEELFSGWKDEKFGSSVGLDRLVDKAGGVDIIIGGPPCQAYSVAGRVRDENGMKDDYRNYLFEHYLSVVHRYQPKIFVFENVPGMLSAIPDGTPITDLVRDGFDNIGYDIVQDIKAHAKVDASDFGVPQARKRLIIIGVNREQYSNSDGMLIDFYENILPSYKNEHVMTVEDAIGDLPACIPIYDNESHKKRISHIKPKCEISWHEPRYHNIRDMEIFHMLSKDIEVGEHKYANSKEISRIYEEKVGSKSPIHRYHVLRKDKPSTTIIAHLYKDGNRFIHYDSKQSRTITPREAARIQAFDDDFEFVGARGTVYQMIGNAVPPKLAVNIGEAVNDLLGRHRNDLR